MPSGRRTIPEHDIAMYWDLRAKGASRRSAASQVGIAETTAARWESNLDRLKVEVGLGVVGQIPLRDVSPSKRRMERTLREYGEPPDPIPAETLSPQAQRGLTDFDFFRRRYLGRVPSPWQVDAAYKIVDMLRSDDREFLVLNCPPGAGKSTLWHDIAVWMIVRDRTIRILIGSISSPLARQYAGRIRDTLGRIVPMKATEEELARGLAVDAEATLAEDYGRFKPRVPAAAWRQDEFVVEQHDGSSTNNKEATVTSYGMDSEFIGHRAELCLFDDAANSDNAREGVTRDRFLEKWDSVAEARCEPGGLLAVIGQRLSAADLYGYCLDKRAVLDDADSDDDGAPLETPKYRHLVYKAYYEELDTGPSSRSVKAAPWPDGPLLDPRRVPWRDLQYVRASSERRFRLVYQQEDPLLEPELIRREWIFGGTGPDGILYPGCVDKSRSRGQVPTGLAGDVVSIATIDPSPSKYWGITWWLYQPSTDMRYLVDVELRKMTAEELLGWSVDNRAHHGLMEDWQQRSVDLGHRITHWVVEINAAQRFLLAHEFVRRWVARNRVDILPHTTGRNKIDDDLGVEALLPPVYRAGSISIPYASGGSIDFRVKSFITQAMSWRPDKKQDTDLVMAHWFAELYWPRLSPAKAPPKQWRPSWLRAG
jgi:hypothetical protein